MLALGFVGLWCLSSRGTVALYGVTSFYLLLYVCIYVLHEASTRVGFYMTSLNILVLIIPPHILSSTLPSHHSLHAYLFLSLHWQKCLTTKLRSYWQSIASST